MFKKVLSKIFGSSPKAPSPPATPAPTKGGAASVPPAKKGASGGAAAQNKGSVGPLPGKKADKGVAERPKPKNDQPPAPEAKPTAVAETAPLAAEPATQATPAVSPGEVKAPTPTASATAVSAQENRPKAKAIADWEEASKKKIDRSAKPEELCGVTSSMSKEEIRAHLAMLYRRHNRAAASLDGALREEGELMLDAIVRCREKFLGGEEPVA